MNNKSWSTIKAEAPFCSIKSFIIFAKDNLCSTSKYADGSSNKYNLASVLRHNAIESARLTCNRYLEKNLGKGNYHFKIRIYPHHVIKENPLATGAGADRMSTGMKKAFGKPIGVAAQVKKNQILFSVGVDKQHKEVAKHSLKRISYKLPFKSKVLERDWIILLE